MRRTLWITVIPSVGSVSHPTIPAYFDHTLHLDTFEDAVEYACDKARALACAREAVAS